MSRVSASKNRAASAGAMVLVGYTQLLKQLKSCRSSSSALSGVGRHDGSVAISGTCNAPEQRKSCWNRLPLSQGVPPTSS